MRRREFIQAFCGRIPPCPLRPDDRTSSAWPVTSEKVPADKYIASNGLVYGLAMRWSASAARTVSAIGLHVNQHGKLRMSAGVPFN
jgi:hypothetical protein